MSLPVTLVSGNIWQGGGHTWTYNVPNATLAEANHITTQYYEGLYSLGDVNPTPTPTIKPTPAPGEDSNRFQFEVLVTAGQTFRIPTSGGGGSQPYNWRITWEEGATPVIVSGTGNNDGIAHTYATAGTKLITIGNSGCNGMATCIRVWR
jgi:hypothetical protein